MMEDPAPLDELSPENLKRAMNAFKKRLKLMRLDAESTVGGSPLSSGRRCGIVAVRPPDRFPQAVWDKLVATGKLKSVGDGLYELGQGH